MAIDNGQGHVPNELRPRAALKFPAPEFHTHTRKNTYCRLPEFRKEWFDPLHSRNSTPPAARNSSSGPGYILQNPTLIHNLPSLRDDVSTSRGKGFFTRHLFTRFGESFGYSSYRLTTFQDLARHGGERAHHLLTNMIIPTFHYLYTTALFYDDFKLMIRKQVIF
jgi:hypothetical protein